MFFNIIFSFYLFLFSLVVHYILFKLILYGYMGISLKIALERKINTNDFMWFNTIIFMVFFISFILYCYINSNYILLENKTIWNCNINGTNFVISGYYLNLLLNPFFTASGWVNITAFGIGARIAGALYITQLMVISRKRGRVLGSVLLSSFLYNIFTITNKIIMELILARRILNSITLDIKYIYFNSLADKTLKTITNLNQNNLLPKMQLNFNETILSKIENLFINKINIVNNTGSKFKVIESIETQNSSSIDKIFSNSENNSIVDNPISFSEIKNNIINSPLENGDLYVLQNQIIELLNYSFIINLIMVYFIFMGIFIFTIKIIIDKKISIDFVKRLPFGKFIHFMLKKLFSIWSNSNIFWIYLIFIVLLLGTISTTFALYACLFVLQD